MSAFRAIRDGKNIKDTLRIVLADTWNQPDANIQEDFIAENDEITLNQLNEYCLLEIFRHLDLQSLLHLSRVCDRFDKLIHRRVFPLVRKIALDLRPDSTQLRSLASIRDILMNVGHHANHIKMEIDMYDHPPNTIRIMDIVTKNLGENLQRLDLIGVFINDRLHEQLKPIFQQLKFFKWDCDYFDERGYEVDFVHWCPLLEKLKLRSFMRCDINAEKWPSLVSATLNMFSFYESESYPQFFMNNGQLKRLKINIYHHFQMINDICFRLTNLETLKIYCCEGGEARSFRELVNLKELKVLRLSTVSFAGNNPQEFITLLSQLTNLVKLDINIEYFGSSGVYVPQHCQIAALGKKLINLKEFYIGRYGFTEDTLIAFIKATPKMIIFKFSDCNLTINENILEKIIQIRKIQAENENRKCLSLDIYVDDDSLFLKDDYDIVTIHLLDKDASEFEYF